MSELQIVNDRGFDASAVLASLRALHVVPSADDLAVMATEQHAEAVESERARLRRYGIPERLVEKLTAGRGSLDRSIMRTNTIVRTWRWITGEPSSRILVLSGKLGIGKSLAAAWALSCSSSGTWRRMTELVRVGLYDAQGLAPYLASEALVVDDVGSEYADARGVARALLDEVVATRYDAGLRTILTTNLTHSDFVERYGQRVADRIREVGAYFEDDTAESLRGKGPKQCG